MNKWQIICPVVGLALFAMFVFRSHGPSTQERIAMSTRWLAQDLQPKTNSALLVSITPALNQALREFLTTPTAYVETYRDGDEPGPIGDGAASHRVYMRNEKDQIVALRLKYDQKLKKFHFLGFWRPTSWPD